MVDSHLTKNKGTRILLVLRRLKLRHTRPPITGGKRRGLTLPEHSMWDKEAMWQWVDNYKVQANSALRSLQAPDTAVIRSPIPTMVLLNPTAAQRLRPSEDMRRRILITNRLDHILRRVSDLVEELLVSHRACRQCSWAAGNNLPNKLHSKPGRLP
jgi:hypothetical protein